jgi:hypothetical protein
VDDASYNRVVLQLGTTGRWQEASAAPCGPATCRLLMGCSFVNRGFFFGDESINYFSAVELHGACQGLLCISGYGTFPCLTVVCQCC